MGHQLNPRCSEAAAIVEEIERRLRGAFAHVLVDLEDGARFVSKRADSIEARPTSFFNNPNENIAARRRSLLTRAKELRALPYGAAARFIVGDSPYGTLLSFLFVPGDPIMFGYSGTEEEQMLRPRIHRCATRPRLRRRTVLSHRLRGAQTR